MSRKWLQNTDLKPKNSFHKYITVEAQRPRTLSQKYIRVVEIRMLCVSEKARA